VAVSNPGEDAFAGGAQILSHTVSGAALVNVGDYTQDGEGQ
jgi:hypothetical protein